MARPGNPEARREAIALALRTLMAVRGYEGATVAEVAKAAGIAPGLVHYYFADKRAILLHLIALLGERAKVRVDARVAKAGKDPRERLLTVVDALLGRGPDDDPEAVAAWVFAGAEAARDEVVRGVYEQQLVALAELLRERVLEVLGHEGRSSTAARAISSAVLAAMQGYFVLSVSAPQVTPAGSAADALKVMTCGLLDAAPVRARAKKSGGI